MHIHSFNTELGSRDTVVNKTDKVLASVEITSKGRDTDNNQVKKWMNNMILDGEKNYKKNMAVMENAWLEMQNYCKFYNHRRFHWKKLHLC